MVLGSVINCLSGCRDGSVSPVDGPSAAPSGAPQALSMTMRRASDLHDDPTKLVSPSPLSTNPVHIHEANINNPGRDYIDQRRINHFNFDPEREAKLSLEGRQLLDELRKESSLVAISYARERAYAPRCHSKTRGLVLEHLQLWSTGQGPLEEAQFLVLTAPAGHGKTAIMQTFVERLLKSQTSNAQLVVASFFFRASAPGPDQPDSLVATLAHQVAGKSSPTRPYIVDAIRNDTGIFSASLDHQMEHLLVQPLISATRSTDPHFTLIAAVDGLDECDGDEAQSGVICLLHTLSKVPNARIVVASRPQFPIESAIKRGMSGMLHIDLNKEYGAAKDILQFTWDRLLEIRDTHPSLHGTDTLSWPREGDAEQIAEYASGQFILADTAIRYVDDRRYDPRERLEEVLALCGGARPAEASPASTRPLGALDTLFAGILERAARNAYPDLEIKEAILELASLVWILIEIIPSKKSNVGRIHSASACMPLWVIEEALDLQYGALARELSDLHSLLDVPEETYGCKDIGAHHKSFLDFLGDPRRSGHLGDISLRSKSRFDDMITRNLCQMTQNDVMKGLILTQPTKPRCLHFLHILCEPQAVIDGVGTRVWKALLSSLNTWETLCLQDWVLTGLREGPSLWLAPGGSQAEAFCQTELWGGIIPGISKEDLPNPPSVSDMGIEELRSRLKNPVNWRSKDDAFAYTPSRGSLLGLVGSWTRGFPWFPFARVLGFLWAPEHRLAASHDVLRPVDPQFVGGRNLHIQQGPQLVFVIGSPGAGKRELLKEAYYIVSVRPGKGGEAGALGRNWALPPVDILITPDGDRLSLKSLWTSGSYQVLPSGRLTCDNQKLMENVNLSRQNPASLFQDWTRCWKNKDKRNTHHPQFLLQGLHLLSPEHQAMLLEIISSEAGLSRSTGRLPFFITITSLPTETLASKLRHFSGRGVYYINLDAMKADVAVIEVILVTWADTSGVHLPPLKLSKLARTVASSPRPFHHIKKLIALFTRFEQDSQCGNRLDPILAAPESEAWQLIDEHLEDISSEDGDGGDSEDSEDSDVSDMGDSFSFGGGMRLESDGGSDERDGDSE